MSVAAAPVSKEDKITWLMRPLNWAYSLSIIAGVLGLILTLQSEFDARVIAMWLSGALLVIFCLLLWAIGRLAKAVRGY